MPSFTVSPEQSTLLLVEDSINTFWPDGPLKLKPKGLSRALARWNLREQ
jgi:hypothetical protein